MAIQTLGMELPAEQFFRRYLFEEVVLVPALGENGKIDLKFDIRTNTVSFTLRYGDAVYRLRKGFVFSLCKPDGTSVLTEVSVKNKVIISGERLKAAFEQGATSVAFRAINRVVALVANPTSASNSARSG